MSWDWDHIPNPEHEIPLLSLKGKDSHSQMLLWEEAVFTVKVLNLPSVGQALMKSLIDVLQYKIGYLDHVENDSTAPRLQPESQKTGGFYT